MTGECNNNLHPVGFRVGSHHLVLVGESAYVMLIPSLITLNKQ